MKKSFLTFLLVLVILLIPATYGLAQINGEISEPQNISGEAQGPPVAPGGVQGSPGTPGVSGPAPIGFQPLAPLPGFTNSSDLNLYLNNLFKLGLGFAALMAVIYIAIGGIEYIGSEGVTSKEDGRRKITGAITGIIILLFSYLLLNTISPQFVKTTINLPPVGLKNTEELKAYPGIEQAVAKDGYRVARPPLDYNAIKNDEARAQAIKDEKAVCTAGGGKMANALGKWVCIEKK